ncbi:MAG: aromatic ring-hydroxylating dioxygenase subunit alpha [Pseudomonadota bacterium]
MGEQQDRRLAEGFFSPFDEDDVVKRGLPASAYTEKAFWRQEMDQLFPKSWVLAGFVHELTRPGDAIPTRVAGRPLLMLRDADGAVRVFHNVCRHRCLELVDQAQHFERGITCPYHHWTYDLKGCLKSTPFFGGPKAHTPSGFDPGQNGLIPVRFHVLHDWIFVNLDGQAPAFEDYAANLLDQLSGIALERLVPVATIDFGAVATNWKFLMENFIEPYHVQYVHKTTTDQPLRDHHTVIDGRCLGSAVNISKERGKSNGKSNSLAVSSRYLTLFPSFVCGCYAPDQVGVYLHQPMTPGLTQQRRAIYLIDGHERPEAEVVALKELWTSVHLEDHAMCERLQRGRASPVAADGGALSPHWEDSVRRFQEMVADAVR